MTLRPVRRRVLLRLLGYVRPYRRHATLLVACVLAGTSADLTVPLVIQHVVDDALAPRSVRVLLPWVCGLLAARVIVWVADVGRGWLAARFGGGLTAEIRRQVYDRLEHAPLACFDGAQTGALMARVVEDASRVEELLTTALPLVVANLFTALGIVAFITVTSPRLLVVALLPMPFIALLAYRAWPALLRAWEQQGQASAQLS